MSNWKSTNELFDGDFGELFLLANYKTKDFYLGIHQGAGYFEIKPLPMVLSLHDFTHFVSLKSIVEKLHG